MVEGSRPVGETPSRPDNPQSKQTPRQTGTRSQSAITFSAALSLVLTVRAADPGGSLMKSSVRFFPKLIKAALGSLMVPGRRFASAAAR